MDPFSIVSGLVGVAGGIGNMFAMGKANKRLKRLQADDPRYQISDVAKERLATAQLLLNARMPGAAAAERNIYGAQANTQANVARNSTDSSQALALGAASQAQTNQAFQNLGQTEAEDYYNRLQNLTGAQQGMIGEQDKLFQDDVRRFENRAQIEGAQAQNTSNMWKSIGNLGFAGMNFGISGGFAGGGMGGGQGGGVPQPGGAQGGGGQGSGMSMAQIAKLLGGIIQ